MAAAIHQLITAPDAWLAQHDVPRSRDRWCMRPCATACYSMPSPEELSWGWVAQQCLEKTLKAWIHATGSKPPATHDIARLLLLLEQAGVETSELQRQRRQLSTAFRHREAVLSRVRGRIDHLTTCRFEELTVGSPRNRFVRTALASVAGWCASLRSPAGL